MTTEPDNDFLSETPVSSRLGAIVALFRALGVPSLRPEALQHTLGNSEPSPVDVVRYARQVGLKSRLVRVAARKLPTAPLPAIAVMKDGSFFLLLRVSIDQALLFDPVSQQPRITARSEFDEGWAGELILAARRSSLDDSEREFDIKWFFSAIYKYRWILSEVLIVSLFLQIFALASPLFFQVVIDKVLVHRGISTLDVIVVAVVTVAVFEAVLGALRTYLFSHTTNRIDVELGARLFRHLLALPLRYFEVRRVGDSVARVRELENIRSFITGSALTLVIDLIFTSVFLAVMLVYSTNLTLVVVASFPFYVAISVFATPILRTHLAEKFRRGAQNQAFLVEAVTGVETLKAAAVEPQLQRRWEEQLSSYVTASFRASNVSNIAGQGIQLVGKLVTAALLYLGAREVIGGSMTVGELVAFNMFAQRVGQPVLRLAQQWQDFQQTRLSIERLGDILNTPPEAGLTAARTELPRLRGEVVFDRIRFRYRPDGPLVLNDVELRISAGEVVGVVGQSGSGKSTLAKILQRLYVPESGRVLVDGTQIAVMDPTSLRRQIGVVLQDNLLLNISVRENIALSDPGMPLARVIHAAKMAGAHEFIADLPEGYDTVVGERGSALSGGQRQRIAIARALITDPRILILDEATSALDYESERVVQQNLQAICKGRTVLIIAHRLSSVRHANRIVTMENGRLVEQGSHDELLQAGGRYARLHALQGGMHAAE